MGKVIAAYGGGFKPPTKGHFQVVEDALSKYPEIDEFIIYVGSGTRDGISQLESILVWEVYSNYLPMKVKIEPSKSPIGDIIRLGKNNPQDTVYFIIGSREGNEGDQKDYESRTKNIEEKYPNMEIKLITTSQGEISGTKARKALLISPEEFYKFTPEVLNDNERGEVFDTLRQSISETLNENASYSKDISIQEKIDQLTHHMLDKGMNIEPLPKVEFVDGDSDNARDFLGKTAYYNPETQTITLFTEGRHPKDIVRSFSHEMIHHIQNLEGRLGNITTTNTQEDDNLNDIEAEANLKGTMTFRNWTDSLNEAIVGDKIECDNCDWSWNIVDGGDDLFICHKCGHDNTPLGEKKNKDPFGLNQYARELASGLEEEIDEGRKNKKLREIKMSLDDHILISKVFRDKSKMKQIHSLLVQMFPKQKELLDYNYKSDGFNDFRPFIFYIDKYTFEGPNLVPHTKLKLDPDTYKKRDKKYKEYIEGKIDRYFNTSDSDPRKVDLSKVPPITIDAKGIVAGGNHRAFLAIKQQKPLRAYQVVNATNSHPNVEKILNIIGRKKQNLNEGRYDKITNQVSREVFTKFKEIYDSGTKKGNFTFSVGPDDEEIFSNDLEFNLEGYMEVSDEMYQPDGGANAGYDDDGEEITPLIQVSFKIPQDPKEFKWSEISFDIKDIVRHEIEHLTQDGENIKSGKYLEDDQLIRKLIDAKMLPKSQYFKLEKEVDAMLQGLYFRAKKSRTPFKEVILNYFKKVGLTKEEQKQILNVWRKRRKALALPTF